MNVSAIQRVVSILRDIRVFFRICVFDSEVSGPSVSGWPLLTAISGVSSQHYMGLWVVFHRVEIIHGKFDYTLLPGQSFHNRPSGPLNVVSEVILQLGKCYQSKTCLVEKVT